MVEQLPQSPPSALPLTQWHLCGLEAGSIAHPAQLGAAGGNWLPAEAPGTVAGALARANQWSFAQPPDLDGRDWWYRAQFPLDASRAEGPLILCCDGLATLAEVWLNGEPVLTADNMFRAYRAEISRHAREQNELTIVFRALGKQLQQKRPRPRWKTNLVNHQQLRWIRTSLQGRIPGWSPPAPPVGPWRGIRLESGAQLRDVQLISRVRNGVGMVDFAAIWPGKFPGATLCVGPYACAIAAREAGGGTELAARLQIPEPPLWWPRTHGPQPLLPCTVELENRTLPLGKLGFRTMETARGPGFGLIINGVPIYGRGACWTTPDSLTLAGSEAALRHDLQLAAEAGANLLRVGGTMVYESDRFYELCDELGLLVWQDFMFANMDYPVADEVFRANIRAEAREQLARLARHPAVVTFCGNSEVEQQAAMLGMPRELWRNDWFGDELPALCRELAPDAAYVPSTPSGGALPFHLQEGVSHFYGIGAYLRDIKEVRAAKVAFTPECLGFANLPEPSTIEAVMEGALPALHHPRWKQRVPRDTGAGWDFEDVRDFYLQQRFGVDPARLRSFDMPRYLQLSRIVSGEMMSLTFAEWRSEGSVNRGGLVWFYKDLWPGAGWGVVDSFGLPKAAYYYLRRTWQPQAVFLTDEGLEGLRAHWVNDRPADFAGSLEISLLKAPDRCVVAREIPVRCRPHGRGSESVDAILGAFYDANHAYRFGPPHHDVVVATLYDERKQVISVAHHFIDRQTLSAPCNGQLSARMQRDGEGAYDLTLTCDQFLDTVRLAARGYLPDDNYFHLLPRRSRLVRFRPLGTERETAFEVACEALNLSGARYFSPDQPGGEAS
jgi:beta-mannosidase